MKRALVLFVFVATVLCAREVRRNHQGVLLRMMSVPCGAPDSNPFSNTLFGKPSGDAGEEKVCPEYVMRSEGNLYRIRQRTTKDATLLPIGSTAQFRIEKFRMYLQVEDFDNKSYEFQVMAVVPESHVDDVKVVDLPAKPPAEAER